MDMGGCGRGESQSEKADGGDSFICRDRYGVKIIAH